MFVRALGDEAIDRLRALPLVELIAELTSVRAKPIPQLPLLRAEAAPRLVVLNGQQLDRLTRSGLGDATRVLHPVFELLAKVAIE
jgi:hypothetical protein